MVEAQTRTEAKVGMFASIQKIGIGALVPLVLGLGFPTHAVRGAAVESAPTSRFEAPEIDRPAPLHFEAESVCESPRCSASDGEESCTACRVWDYAQTGLAADAVAFESRIVENGVVLRATSDDPHVQQLLWTVSVARHHVLELVRNGGRVPLCAPCRLNVQAFAEVEVGTSRLPDGVLLMYTSSNTEMVSALHTMLLAGQDLPL